MSKKIDSFSGEYTFLSNFYLHTIEFQGFTYASSEHAYQASKSLDENIRWIHSVEFGFTPGESKKFGRYCELRPDWEDIKINIMTNICKLKFQDPILKQKLLDTGDAELIEGNWWGDKFWSV